MGNGPLRGISDLMVQKCRPWQPALTAIRRVLSFAQAPLGSIEEVKRYPEPIFNSKEAAEEHGLKLCNDWIDNRPLTHRPPGRRTYCRLESD